MADEKETIKSVRELIEVQELRMRRLSDSLSAKKDEVSTKQCDFTKPTKIRIQNNNHQHIVPVGVLIVLFTLYLTVTALQSKYKNHYGYHIDKEVNKQYQEDPKAKQIENPNPIKEKTFGEINRFEIHEDACMDIDIFVEGFIDEKENFKYLWTHEAEAESDTETETEMTTEQRTDDEREAVDGIIDKTEDHVLNTKQSTTKKQTIKKNKQRRPNGHKHTKNSHGHRHNNKSENKQMKLIKNGDVHKKEQKDTKKSSTAEPIIYLFALVFIYLLLKAASDINQHYKSQSKGDKRLRRCSLQSYAQTHKQDRRASKESPLRQKQRLLEFRSISVDRYNNAVTMSEFAEKKAEMLANLQKHASMEISANMLPQQQNRNFIYSTPTAATCMEESSNNLIQTPSGSAEMLSTQNRRCSVPASLNYQRHKIPGMPVTAMANTSRRTSIAIGNISGMSGFGVGGHLDGFDMQFPENRRRVRMINRH